MNKRLTIYMTYNKNGIIDDYIVYMLKQLVNVSSDIIVVSNKKLKQREKEKIAFVSEYIERGNEKFDVGAYSQVIKELYDKRQIYEYDELVLINDSVFGPFFDLNDMFSAMDRRKGLDFWGITKRGRSDFDGGAGVYPEHIQSYFYAFRKSIISQDAFKEYWQQVVDEISDFRSAILNYEFKLTEHFEKLGFKWDTYCDCNDYIGNNINRNFSPYHYSTYELIKDKRCPFLKRKLFTGDFVNKEYTDAVDLKNAYNFIKDNTDYDLNLIWDYVLREYELSSIMNAMQMVEIIDKPIQEENESKDKAELFFFIKRDDERLSYIEQKANENVLNNINDERYLGSIKSLFNNDSRLGVLIPPMKTFGKVSLSLSHSWINLNVFEKMKDKLEITVPYLLDKAPVYQINGLVCRKELLSNDVIKLLELDKTGTILQMIPLIAQEKGYYTKQVITKDYVATQIYNLTGMLSVLGEKISDNARNYSVREMTDQLMEEKIKHFLVSAKKVYIYGAGELACRVAEIAKKYCNLRGILVSNKRSNLSNICGIQVMQYSELKYKDIDVIVAVGKKNNRNIERILKDDNIKNILYVD